MLKKIRLERLVSSELEEGMIRENYRSKPLDKSLIQEAEKKAKFYLGGGRCERKENHEKK